MCRQPQAINDWHRELGDRNVLLYKMFEVEQETLVDHAGHVVAESVYRTLVRTPQDETC